MSTTLNLESTETLSPVTPPPSPSVMPLNILSHDDVIDRSHLSTSKQGSLSRVHLSLCEAILKAHKSLRYPIKPRCADKRCPVHDFVAVLEIFRQALEKVYGYILYFKTFTEEEYSEDVRVPGSAEGSHLCVYAMIGGSLTKVMTIQDTEIDTMHVIIRHHKLKVLLSGSLVDHSWACDVKVEGFLRNDSDDVVPVTHKLILTLVTPDPTAPLMERRIMHRALSDLEIPSSSRNLDASFAVCAEEEEESKRKRQRVSASAPSSPALTLRRV